MRPSGFPLLEHGYDGAPFIYLDSASTTPKPREVVAAVTRYYETLGANVHRGIYPLAEAATEEYERARHRVAALIGAQPAEIVFTRNATDSFNLVARA
jgi:cysteine desulfurase/selenocysteine lyase